MSAANKEDDILDNLLGPAEPDPGENEEEDAPLAASEDADTAGEPDAETAEDPGEGEGDRVEDVEDEESPEDGASEGEEQGEPGPSPGSPAPTDTEKELAAAKRHAEGLQKEIARLRQKQRAREAERAKVQAPAPVRIESESPAPEQPMGIPVNVSEDGTSVFVDTNSVTETAEQAARRVFEQMSTPTPAQLKAQEEARVMQEFVSAAPDVNRAVFEEAQQADEFIALSIQGALDEAGARIPPDMPLAQRIAIAQQIVESEGISERVAEHFPRIAPVLQEFIAASSSSSDNPMWKRSVLERIASSGEGVAPQVKPSRVQSIDGTPKSMARKGGVRSTSPNAEESEFEALEKEFRSDPAFMPEKKYERYMELGKKLGRSGLD